MEMFTTAEEIGFVSDCDILYSLERSDPPGYYMLARKNNLLGKGDTCYIRLDGATTKG